MVEAGPRCQRWFSDLSEGRSLHASADGIPAGLPPRGAEERGPEGYRARTAALSESPALRFSAKQHHQNAYAEQRKHGRFRNKGDGGIVDLPSKADQVTEVGAQLADAYFAIETAPWAILVAAAVRGAPPLTTMLTIPARFPLPSTAFPRVSNSTATVYQVLGEIVVLTALTLSSNRI